VLDHTRSVYNIYDVLVMACDTRNINDQIDKAIYYAENTSGVTQQQRLSLSMSIHNLRESLQDNDRVQKIQGLLDPPHGLSRRGPRGPHQDPTISF